MIPLNEVENKVYPPRQIRSAGGTSNGPVDYTLGAPGKNEDLRADCEVSLQQLEFSDALYDCLYNSRSLELLLGRRPDISCAVRASSRTRTVPARQGRRSDDRRRKAFRASRHLLQPHSSTTNPASL
jgi:hypothetical protein